MEQEQFIQQLSELAEIKLLNKDNPHEGYQVKRIKHLPKACEDCGKQVVNRRIWNRVLFTPQQHWRKTCSGCNLNQHPETGEYTVSQNGATAFFNTFLTKQNK